MPILFPLVRNAFKNRKMASSSAHAPSDPGLTCDKCGMPGLQGQRGLATHVGMSVLCRGALGLDARQRMEQHTAAQALAQASQSKQALREQERCSSYRTESRAAMLDHLQEQRFGKLREATAIGDSKQLVETALEHIRPELYRRVQPHVASGTMDLRAVIQDVCDVFGQHMPSDAPAGQASIFTERAEMKAHAASFGSAAVEAQERTLGWQAKQSMDAEGQPCGPTRLVRSFCYDVPVDGTLRRLFQTDPRAWQMVLDACAAWERAIPDDGATERVVFDIPDGEYFSTHPNPNPNLTLTLALSLR